MIYKKVKYKWVSLYDAQFSDEENPSYLVLQNMDMIVPYDTETEDTTNGARWMRTRPRDRTWRISGYIADAEAFNRQYGVDYLKKIIKPEAIKETQEFRIEWQDFQNRTFWAMARVIWEVKFNHNVQSPLIEFSFELWSGTPQYFWNTLHSETITPIFGSFWVFSGDEDGVHLGTVPDGWYSSGAYALQNDGNYEAGVKISDNSQWDSVYYMNATNWLRYWVTWVSNARIIDTNYRPTLVTDYWIDASKNRMRGSTGFLLSPGENMVSANVSSYDFSNPPLDDSITIEWYDTYI